MKKILVLNMLLKNPSTYKKSVTDVIGKGYIKTLDAYRYGFNGKEKDQETGDYDYGFRMYKPGLGRFMSVDPLTSAYPELSPYQFASNMPIWAIDLDGLEAWKVTSKWTPRMIGQYQNFVAKRAKQLISMNKKYTCEDFTLAILIDFASSNGLPVRIQNNSGQGGSQIIYDASSTDFHTVDEYKNTILKTTSAKDLQNSFNAIPVPEDQANAGDIILNRDHDPNVANHAQLITHRSGNEFDIAQGNLPPWYLGGRLAASQRIGGDDPSSPTYAGQSIQTGRYSGNQNSYSNFSKGSFELGFSNNHNIQFMRFNFNNFNNSGNSGTKAKSTKIAEKRKLGNSARNVRNDRYGR